MSPNPKDEAAPGDRSQRREPRLPLSIQIEVSGIDSNAQPFCQRTLTSEVSDSGCQFALPRELKEDSIVAVRVLSTPSESPLDARPMMFQVRHVCRASNGWMIGVWKLESENVWGMPLSDLAKPRKDGPASSPLVPSRSGK